MDLSAALDDISNWLNALAAPIMAAAPPAVPYPDDWKTDHGTVNADGTVPLDADTRPMTVAPVSGPGSETARSLPRTASTKTVQPSTSDGATDPNDGRSPLPTPGAIPAAETHTNQVAMVDRSRGATVPRPVIELPDRTDGPHPPFEGMLSGFDTKERSLAPGPGPAAIHAAPAKPANPNRADTTLRPDVDNAAAPSPLQPSQSRTTRRAIAAMSPTPTENTITAALESMFDQPAAWRPSPAAARTPAPTVAPFTVANQSTDVDELEDLADQLALHLEDTGLALGRLELER